MEFTFKVDSDNFITFDTRIQRAGADSYGSSAEVVSAVVSKQELSQLTADDILDIASQLVDYVSREQKPSKPSDWFADEWLPATRGTQD